MEGAEVPEDYHVAAVGLHGGEAGQHGEGAGAVRAQRASSRTLPPSWRGPFWRRALAPWRRREIARRAA